MRVITEIVGASVVVTIEPEREAWRIFGRLRRDLLPLPVHGHYDADGELRTVIVFCDGCSQALTTRAEVDRLVAR